MSLDIKGMDRSVRSTWYDYHADCVAEKFIGSKNADILKRLHRAPVVEPSGDVVTFRARGLQSGLIGFVQSCEELMVQFASIRGELELCANTGRWSMKQLGSFADDATQSGDWDDHDSLLSSRLNSFGISGPEVDPWKTEIGAGRSFKCLGYSIAKVVLLYHWVN